MAIELRSRDNLPPQFQGAFGENVLKKIDCGELLYDTVQRVFVNRISVTDPPPIPEECVAKPSAVFNGTTWEETEVQVLNRDTLPEEWKTRFKGDESVLGLIDCGELLYVSSMDKFVNRSKVQNPPDKPDECYKPSVQEISLVDGEARVTVDEPTAVGSDVQGVLDSVGTGGPSGTTDGSSSSDTSVGSSFCGQEERVSNHTCNSKHPATSIDPFGNVGIVWHDTRNGTHEIYFKTLASKITESEALSGQDSKRSNTERVVDLNCFKPEDSPQKPDDIVEYDASSRCASETINSGAQIRTDNGRLDVNVNSRTITLSSTGGGIDFVELEVQVNSKIRIEDGVNAGIELLVKQVLSPSVLEANYIDGATSDTGFKFTVMADASYSLTTCETRLTCSKGISSFPDVITDSEGRFHVVYQHEVSGDKNLYYVQLAPRNVGIKDKCSDAPPLNFTDGFGEVPPGTPGSITVTDDTDPTAPTEKAFMRTGEEGAFFSYGSRFLAPPRPNGSPILEDRTGEHRLFRDFLYGDGRWTGVSLAADRPTWDAQIDKLNQSVVPEVEFGSGHPLASSGDFGARHTFEHLSFMALTPPDAAVNVRLIALRIKPRCSPSGLANERELREQDLVRVPKRPPPPNFSDPVDLSQILNLPSFSQDARTPARFIVEGDVGNTVFTNIIESDANSRLSRLVFRKDTGGDEIKFILGKQACGDYFCGVKVSDDTVLVLPDTNRYRMTLQVWQGSDYRIGEEQVESAQMSAILLYEKKFSFDTSEEISSFLFEEGELILPEGSVIFFVPVAEDNTEFMIEGVGGGNRVWATNSDGLFDRYMPPYTIPPNSGLNAPMYYEGTLQLSADALAVEPQVGPNVITTQTATRGVSVAFGDISTDENIDKADVVSQAFTLSETRTVRSVIIRMAKGTAGGSQGGTTVPADPDRDLLVELYSNDNALPGEAIASAIISGADIKSIDDSDDIPVDTDLGVVTITFDRELEAGTYHIVFSENSATDKLGRFWVISGADGTYPVGAGLWNSNRDKRSDGWRLLAGQLQLMVILKEKLEEAI